MFNQRTMSNLRAMFNLRIMLNQKNMINRITNIVLVLSSKTGRFFLRLTAVAMVVYTLPVITQMTGLTEQGGQVFAITKRRTPALRQRVYAQLSEAQRLADEKKVSEGLAILTRMEQSVDQLNSYEAAMMYNFMAFIHYGENQVKQAVLAFNQVLKQQPIPESLEQSTLFSLAQLQMQMENYDETIALINRWKKINTKGASSSSERLLANAYYAKKQYTKALKHINQSLAFDADNGNVPNENMLVLKRATHYELKQPKQVTEVSEDLVRYHSKPKYWVELANMYGEIGETKKQLAVMEAAYQQGFVTKASDLKTLAQIYYLNGAPYKAANLLKQAIDDDILNASLKNLEFLAQAWTSAKEFDKAIPVLKQAAQVSNDGNAYARLAEVYVNTESWSQVIANGKKALDKGELKNPGNVNIALGMAYFNLKKFDQSKAEFAKAAEHQKLNKMASQWMSYVAKEENKWTQLAAEYKQLEVL